MANEVETIFVKTRPGYEVDRIVFSEMDDRKVSHCLVNETWNTLGGAWIVGSKDEVTYEVADTDAVREAINKGRIALGNAPVAKKETKTTKE